MSNGFYVTTPIYYVNDVPHIGHAYTTVAGDVITRWRRLHGDDVFYLTGTDEHGAKIAQAAEAKGLTPAQLADQTSERFREAWAGLNIANDDFIRTTEPRHYAAVQKFLQAVYDEGDIELNTYEGLYCVKCEAYYTEDQLVDGNCPDHGTPVEKMKEENYFFKLSRYEQKLLDYYQTNPSAVQPVSRMNEVLGFIKGGLQDFSMSRTSIDWGIPIPWDPKHVAYVWFDALFNYCTAVGAYSDEKKFDNYWPADYHLVGKDILRFHAVFWPAMLMSAGLPLPKCVFAHGWLLVGGEKMSKSKLNQILPADLVADFGVDGFRYHFLADQGFGPDGDFSYEAMVARYNSDLANNFGNLANRVLNMAVNYCGGVAPAAEVEMVPLQNRGGQVYAEMEEAFSRLDFTDAYKTLWGFIGDVNAYIEATQPWALHKAGEKDRVDQIMGTCLEALRMIAILASPVIPSAAQELWSRLGFETQIGGARQATGSPILPVDGTFNTFGLPTGQKITKGDPLFPRLDPR